MLVPATHRFRDVSLRHLRQTVQEGDIVAAAQETRVRKGGSVRVCNMPREIQAQTQFIETL